MEDNSQASQNLSSSPKTTPTHTGLLRAEYVCPVCNATVVTIEGNVFRYLKSHIREVEDENVDHVSLVMYHHLEGGNFLPGKLLEQPFLSVQSSVMTPFSVNS